MCTFLNSYACASRFAQLETSQQTAVDFLNQLVNGNFLRMSKGGPVADQICVCLSTICALSKEFNLDWISEDVASRPIDEQKDYLASFGAYLHLPLTTLSKLLTRVRLAGRRRGVPTFQANLDWFWSCLGLQKCNPAVDFSAEGAPIDSRILLIAYLATAIRCYSIWQNRRPVCRLLPWTILANRAGTRITIRYNYTVKVGIGKNAHFEKRHYTYQLKMRIPRTTVDGIREVFNQSKSDRIHLA